MRMESPHTQHLMPVSFANCQASARTASHTLKRYLQGSPAAMEWLVGSAACLPARSRLLSTCT